MRNEMLRRKPLAKKEKRGLSWERNVSFSQKEVSLRVISNPCIEVQTTAENRPSVPAWFAEGDHGSLLGDKRSSGSLCPGLVRLVRGRFGNYEPIDFLALRLRYAMSGERTLSDFFVGVAPFETAFMALFGRRCLPHRSSLSRFLAAVDRPCLEAFRTLFQQHGLADGWTPETIGGLWDRQGRRFIVFDVDATRQAAASSSASVRCCVACCKTPTRRGLCVR